MAVGQPWLSDYFVAARSTQALHSPVHWLLSAARRLDFELGKPEGLFQAKFSIEVLTYSVQRSAQGFTYRPRTTWDSA